MRRPVGGVEVREVTGGRFHRTFSSPCEDLVFLSEIESLEAFEQRNVIS